MTHILIDGYNLIRRSKTLSQIDALDLQKGREALVQKLAAYKKLKGHRITVVFDAAQTDNINIGQEKISGIHLLYSMQGQSADAVIIDLCHQLRDKVIVVSSDREIQHAAKQAGAALMEAHEFEQKMDEAAFYDYKGIDEKNEEPPRPIHKRWLTKKKGPAKRLPKEKRRAAKKLDKI